MWQTDGQADILWTFIFYEFVCTKFKYDVIIFNVPNLGWGWGVGWRMIGWINRQIDLIFSSPDKVRSACVTTSLSSSVCGIHKHFFLQNYWRDEVEAWQASSYLFVNLLEAFHSNSQVSYSAQHYLYLVSWVRLDQHLCPIWWLYENCEL